MVYLYGPLGYYTRELNSQNLNKLSNHEQENRRAEFLDAIRRFYDPDLSHYSGVFQRYLQDLSDWVRCYEWIDLTDPRHLAPRLFPVPQRSEEELQGGVRGLPQEALSKETAGCA